MLHKTSYLLTCSQLMCITARENSACRRWYTVHDAEVRSGIRTAKNNTRISVADLFCCRVSRFSFTKPVFHKNSLSSLEWFIGYPIIAVSLWLQKAETVTIQYIICTGNKKVSIIRNKQHFIPKDIQFKVTSGLRGIGWLTMQCQMSCYTALRLNKIYCVAKTNFFFRIT